MHRVTMNLKESRLNCSASSLTGLTNRSASRGVFVDFPLKLHVDNLTSTIPLYHAYRLVNRRSKATILTLGPIQMQLFL
jgi:hypothetical protein